MSKHTRNIWNTYLMRDIWECPADLMTMLTSVKGFGSVNVKNMIILITF